jgi:hypothetical protein
MRFKAWYVTAVSALFAGAVLLHSGTSFAQNKIGVAAAVKNQVTGNARPLVAGSDVRVREVVRTGPDSMAQLLFLDETSLSIGPQSEVTLDRFVYDPNRRAGNVVFNTGRGVFRFVSGSQQPSSYQIKTPVATIGVRGTVVDWITQIGKTIFIQVHGIGDYKIEPNGPVITLDKPGTALIIYKDGKYEVVQYESLIVNVTAGAPFPLFGYNFLLHPDITGQDTTATNMDQLGAMGRPASISAANWLRSASG